MIAARGHSLGHTGLLGYRWRDFDLFMLITTVVLIGFSVVAIWSATGADSLSLGNEGVRQLYFAVAGLVLMLFIANIDYRFLATLAGILYVAAIASLVLVLVPGVGLEIAGSRRWFQIGQQTIQPSEFAKVATIVALATFIASRGSAMREFSNFVVSILIVAVPMGLVFEQPDLGTSIVFGVIWLAMMLVTQTRKFYFAVMALLAIPGLWVAWRFLFRDYQKERLLVSYDPGLDPFGAGFNIIQARIS
ncbi:MAG: FtsW/RodA/SpoVE family cell cycle protein, partial [Chloroflexota bacterium]|nr:FtsW/RodA/SpoVE family cell cycle protein [Chloroflexota bacterium]